MTTCDKFLQNSKQFDFGYRRIRTTNSYDSYLAIGTTFWQIGFRDQELPNFGKSVFLKFNDITVPLNKRYQMAFCLFEGDGCLTGFVDVSLATLYVPIFSSSHRLSTENFFDH